VVNLITPLLDGLTWGIILVLISMGLTLIFGFLKVLNFAHGAFYMLGGYVFYSVVGETGSYLVGLAAAIVAVAVLAVFVEMVLLRPSYDFGPITQFIVMLGVAFVIEGLIIVIWGPSGKNVNTPDLLTGSTTLGGVSYPSYRLFVALVSLVLIGAIAVFLRYSIIGLAIRAGLTDKMMVRALGYDVPRIYTMVFAGGIIITAFAGALMTPMRGVEPGTGNSILLLAFIVVIIGGIGSFRGSVVAGLGVGLTDIFIARFVSFRLAGLSVFFILLIVLIVRPHGLFGTQGVMD
jgi:branched-subunit amino acid ABC-type transport system permease component